MEAEFEKINVRLEFYPFGVKSEVHPRLFLSLPKLAAFVRREKIDVIHAHTRVTQVAGSALSALTGVPLVTTSHGFFKSRLSRKIFDGWGKRVIAISDLVAKDLEESHRVHISRIRTVPNAIDLVEFQKRISFYDAKAIRREYGIAEDAVVIGCIARLVADKGHGYLIEAFQTLKKENENIFLVLLGDGRERVKLEEMIQRKGLDKTVALIPGLKDTAAILKIMNIFTHPATWREGFGLSIAEAIAARIPVVITDIPAINQIFTHEENALIVPPKNAQALAGAIQQLMQDKDKARKIVENAYNLLLEKYSIDRMITDLEKVYEEVA